jgi:hypothetical protein
MKLRFLAIILPLIVTGCENGPNLAQLCRDNKEICDEYGKDNWCKKERNHMSIARIALKHNPHDVEKFTLLLAYEKYIKCMALASQIQHIKLKYKTTMRKDMLRKAENSLLALTEETITSKNSHLLYYHWSRTANKDSLNTFLSLEGTKALENSIDQYHLATYYVKRKPKKTLRLLYRSLELYKPKNSLEIDILQTLATIFSNQKEFKKGYIWLKAYELSQERPQKWVGETLQQYIHAYELDQSTLDEAATKTLDSILSGTFKGPKVK